MDIIKKKVKKLTEGLSPDKAIIKIFEYVRDLPYKIVTFEDSLNLLKKGYGDCRAKHDLLAKMFEIKGVSVRIGFMRFDWSDLPVPKEFFKELKHIGTIWLHTPLQIKRNNKWTYVDATWDLKLKKAGFPVNSRWDGHINTKLINKPISITFNPIIKKIKMWQEKFKIMKYLTEYSEFAEKLNKYLEKCRRK